MTPRAPLRYASHGVQNRAAQILSVVVGVAPGGCGGKSMLDLPAGVADAPPEATLTSTGSGGSAVAVSSAESTSTSAAMSSAGSASSGGMQRGCSDHSMQRFESLRELALEIQKVKADVTSVLAATCLEIAEDLGRVMELAAPPTLDAVHATCSAAVERIESVVAQVGIGATLTEGTCGCAKDAELYFDCLGPCESQSDGETTCGEVCYCQAYCEAVGMVTPRCSDCSVTVDVADEVLASTLERHLPDVYGSLNRADLGFWGAETLVEAGREFGRGLDDGCSSELAPDLDAVIEATEACVPELAALRDAASSVRTTAAGS